MRRVSLFKGEKVVIFDRRNNCNPEQFTTIDDVNNNMVSVYSKIGNIQDYEVILNDKKYGNYPADKN